jgi:hypothetical protein
MVWCAVQVTSGQADNKPNAGLASDPWRRESVRSMLGAEGFYSSCPTTRTSHIPKMAFRLLSPRSPVFQLQHTVQLLAPLLIQAPRC